MSKSSGNVVHPKNIIDEHGVDVLRCWAASRFNGQGTVPVIANDIKFVSNHMKTIRNHFKFMLGYIKELPDSDDASNDIDYNKLSITDKWCLNALVSFHEKVSTHESIKRFSANFITNFHSFTCRLKYSLKTINFHNTLAT